jgi:hypothetical protein
VNSQIFCYKRANVSVFGEWVAKDEVGPIVDRAGNIESYNMTELNETLYYAIW